MKPDKYRLHGLLLRTLHLHTTLMMVIVTTRAMINRAHTVIHDIKYVDSIGCKNSRCNNFIPAGYITWLDILNDSLDKVPPTN